MTGFDDFWVQSAVDRLRRCTANSLEEIGQIALNGANPEEVRQAAYAVYTHLLILVPLLGALERSVPGTTHRKE